FYTFLVAAAICWIVMYSFFFSSRRRHTRFSRDWSSDVCSSDLSLYYKGRRVRQQTYAADLHAPTLMQALDILEQWQREHIARRRSEERRVGKECRSRWTRDPQKE